MELRSSSEITDIFLQRPLAAYQKDVATADFLLPNAGVYPTDDPGCDEDAEDPEEYRDGFAEGGGEGVVVCDLCEDGQRGEKGWMGVAL